jgi:predicted component of type VI protein secretion system
MLLALSVVSDQGGELGASAYKVFDERGGSIGRIAGNDWVLPDPQNFVSSRHARVSLVEGRFWLEDTSSNGTFINAPDRAASRDRPQPLNDGDRLYIGDYEIIVQIIQDEAPPSALGLGTVDPLAALADTASVPVAAAQRPLDPTRAASTAKAAVGAAGAEELETMVRLAVQAAVRAGFNAMLAKLHPHKLEELYDRKLKRTAMLGLGNKAKYWEMYRAQFEEIDRDREAHFQLLFGEEFALAYNEHLQKLMAEARLRKQR